MFNVQFQEKTEEVRETAAKKSNFTPIDREEREIERERKYKTKMMRCYFTSKDHWSFSGQQQTTFILLFLTWSMLSLTSTCYSPHNQTINVPE